MLIADYNKNVFTNNDEIRKGYKWRIEKDRMDNKIGFKHEGQLFKGRD